MAEVLTLVVHVLAAFGLGLGVRNIAVLDVDVQGVIPAVVGGARIRGEIPGGLHPSSVDELQVLVRPFYGLILTFPSVEDDTCTWSISRIGRPDRGGETFDDPSSSPVGRRNRRGGTYRHRPIDPSAAPLGAGTAGSGIGPVATVPTVRPPTADTSVPAPRATTPAVGERHPSGGIVPLQEGARIVETVYDTDRGAWEVLVLLEGTSDKTGMANGRSAQVENFRITM